MFLVRQITDKCPLYLENINFTNNKDLIEEAISGSMSQKYSNRILDDGGLCISIHSLVNIKNPIIYPTRHYPVVDVVFNALIFQPIPDEVIIATVSLQDKTGIMVSLGFFDQIHIGEIDMPENTIFDTELQSWCWIYDNQRLYIHRGSRIKIKILSTEINVEKRAFSVTATINNDGLGLCHWWE